MMSTLVTLKDFPLGEALAEEVFDMPEVFPPAASHVHEESLHDLHARRRLARSALHPYLLGLQHVLPTLRLDATLHLGLIRLHGQSVEFPDP